MKSKTKIKSEIKEHKKRFKGNFKSMSHREIEKHIINLYNKIDEILDAI